MKTDENIMPASAESPVLITKSEIQDAIHMRGPVGRLVASAAMNVMGLNKANLHYQHCAGGNTYDFAARAMKEVAVSYDVKPAQLDYIPREGPFILLGNHHFGGLDGMMTFDLVGHIRPDYHTLSTFLLGKVPEIKPAMFAVNPFSSNGAGSRSNMTGIKNALMHIRNGGCLGLFAAGAVATYQPAKERTAWEKHIIEDCPWPMSIVKFIRTCHCPVVPVYFEGTCSKRFHRLGRIHPMLRTINLVNETINKRGMTLPMRIGKPIPVSEMNKYETLEELYGFLRNCIYAMQAEFEPERPAQPQRREQCLPALTNLPFPQTSLQRVIFGKGYPKAIQSLIVWFFTQHFSVPEDDTIQKLRARFVPSYRNVRPDQLLSKTDTVEDFDHILKQISDNAFCLPEPVKTIFDQSAKVVCFGVSDDVLEAWILLPEGKPIS